LPKLEIVEITELEKLPTTFPPTLGELVIDGQYKTKQLLVHATIEVSEEEKMFS
jgi:hypothetical protein